MNPHLTILKTIMRHGKWYVHAHDRMTGYYGWYELVAVELGTLDTLLAEAAIRETLNIKVEVKEDRG